MTTLHHRCVVLCCAVFCCVVFCLHVFLLDSNSCSSCSLKVVIRHWTGIEKLMVMRRRPKILRLRLRLREIRSAQKADDFSTQLNSTQLNSTQLNLVLCMGFANLFCYAPSHLVLYRTIIDQLVAVLSSSKVVDLFIRCRRYSCSVL
jgi:hypothetical protein